MNELFQRIGQFIKNMLANLNTFQLFMLSILTILLAGSLVWLVGWGEAGGMVELVSSTESAENKHAVKQKLDQQNVRYEVRNEAIYVPREQKDTLLIDLAGEGIFSDQTIWKWLMEGTDLTSTHDIREKRFLISLQRSLEKKFSTLEGVKSASVSITPANVGSYGFSKSDDAKASVFLTLKPNKTIGKQTVLGIASITAQSVSGLKAKNVSIMDTNGRLYKVPDVESEAGIASDKTEAEAQEEDRIAEKVRNLLAGIVSKEEVYVEVSLDLNFDKMIEDKEELGPPIDIESRESSSEPVTMGSAGGGGTPDLLKGATTMGSGSVAKKEKKTDTVSTPSFRKKTNKVVTPGERKDATISVLLPKKENVKLPTESELKDWIRGATSIDTSKISVAFFEVPKQGEIKQEEVITFAAQIGDYAEKYGGQVALGFFALFSLFMIYRVVKQAMPPKDLYTEIARAREAVGEMPLPGEGGGGMAMPTGGAGVEKVSKMRMGVRDLVLRNPRFVANVLKRWVMSR